MQRILETKLKQKDSNKNPSKEGQGVLVLILAPTRELAIQVHKNLQDVAKAVSVKVCVAHYWDCKFMLSIDCTVYSILAPMASFSCDYFLMFCAQWS